MQSKFYLLVLCFIFSWGIHTFAQGGKIVNSTAFIQHEKLALIGNLGLGSYYGDLCDKFECMQFRPNFGIGAIYRFTNHFSNKTEFNYYRLFSKDVYTDRNLSFRSGNFEAYTSLMFDVFKYTKHFRHVKFLSPYIFGGIGVTTFNPKGQTKAGAWVALRSLQTEGESYSSATMIVPFGLGIKIKFKKHLDFIVEGGYRKTFSDYIDDVSLFHYRDLNEFDNEQAKELSMKSTVDSYSSTYRGQQRGNPDKLDGYFIFNVKVRYIVGAKHTHFKGKHPLLKPHHQ